MKIDSGFAMLDVKEGRDELFTHFGDRPFRPCAPDLRIPVVIRGYIDCALGHDDGVSREFSVIVTELDT